MSHQHRIVIAFSGHMTDDPGREVPRFPESQVARVRERIRALLKNLNASVVGVSSAARGADLTFLRVLLAEGGSAVVYLPFPVRDFKQTSVGGRWNHELDLLLRSPRVALKPPLRAALPPTAKAQAEAYAECNAAIISAAQSLAATPEATLMIVAVCQSTAESSAGGTMDALQRWREVASRVEMIDPLTD